MQFRSTLLGLAGATVLAGPAAADPMTYVGTLDKLAIVVEFTGDPGEPSGPLAARYHYRAQGADIPLQAKSQTDGTFELAEEEACREACEEGKPGPIGATWSLTVKNGGQTLEGTWKAGKKVFDLKLERAGVRPVEGEPPVTPLDLYNFTVNTFYQTENPITIASSPYDFLRLDMPYDVGEKQGWPDATFVYVTDPRTKFPRPRIHSLAGRPPFEKANDLLEDRHWVDNIAALSCKSLQYAGFQEYGPVPGGSDGTLGYYDETTSKVLALTPKLISWSESGSVFCGGAHPYNFLNKFVMDVSSGRMLGLGDIFTDVTAEGLPGETLLGYVRERREKPTDQVEIDFEAECGTDDLISQHLAASLKRDGDAMKIVLGLSGLPHAIQACGDDFMEVPAADVMSLLKPEFAALLN